MKVGAVTCVRVRIGESVDVPTSEIPVRRIVANVGGPLDGWRLKECLHIWYGKRFGTLPPYVRCQRCWLESHGYVPDGDGWYTKPPA